MEEETISVIIPVFNVEKYLDKCLKSIVNQTYKNLEIILIDDGSRDKSGEICDTWCKKDPRIIAIHKENGGVSTARNEGIKCATGTYISFIDSDDYIDLDMYEFLIKNLKKDNADISICSVYDVYNGNVKHNKLENINVKLNNIEALIGIYKKSYYGNGLTNKLFKRELIVDNFFPAGIKNGEEIIVLFKAIKKATTITYSSIPKYYYVVHSNSATHSIISDDACRNIKRLICDNIDFLNSNADLKKYVLFSYNLSLFQYYNHLLLLAPESNKPKDVIFNELKKNKKYIIYSELSFLKKIQIFTFYHFNKVYNLLVYIYRKVRKI